MILGTINGSVLYSGSLETCTDFIYHSIFICCKYNGMFGSSWELALVDNKSVFLIS